MDPVIFLNYGGSKGLENVKEIVDVYFTAHAFPFGYASALMVGGFCCSTVNLKSWGKHSFLIKAISNSYIIS
jgi:hypothetical protein